jgi:hypothetical protein
MRWRGLDPVPPRKRREVDLQKLFDCWGNDAAPCGIAGAPGWLEKLGTPSATGKAAKLPAYGYSYEPDVVWEKSQRVWVAELKCSFKYEPLALAEVLHHAYMLRRQHGKPVTPVLITSYCGWLRAAVALLGEATRDGSVDLRALEVDLFKDSNYAWFDAPHAPWKRSRSPEFLKDGYREWTWFVVPETQTKIGVHPDGRLRGNDPRPLFITVPYVMVAPVRRGQAGNGEFLVWQGRPPPEESEFTRSAWSDSQYWLSSPSLGGKQGPKPIP